MPLHAAQTPSAAQKFTHVLASTEALKKHQLDVFEKVIKNIVCDDQTRPHLPNANYDVKGYVGNDSKFLCSFVMFLLVS
jgi:hypothetical protein